MRTPPTFVVECDHCGAVTRPHRTLFGARQAGREHLERCPALHPKPAEPKEQLGFDLGCGKGPPK